MGGTLYCENHAKVQATTIRHDDKGEEHPLCAACVMFEDAGRGVPSDSVAKAVEKGDEE